MQFTTNFVFDVKYKIFLFLSNDVNVHCKYVQEHPYVMSRPKINIIDDEGEFGAINQESKNVFFLSDEKAKEITSHVVDICKKSTDKARKMFNGNTEIELKHYMLDLSDVNKIKLNHPNEYAYFFFLLGYGDCSFETNCRMAANVRRTIVHNGIS